MRSNDLALDFLSRLESAETALLVWGVVDSFFSEDEILERAETFLEANRTETTEYETGGDLVSALLDERLLWTLPGSNRYRTRMAETVRLFSRLRQIFPNAANDSWHLAPNLVADYRLLLRRRIFPLRTMAPDAVVDLVGESHSLTALQTKVLKAFLRVGMADERLTAPFQARATARILRMTGQSGSAGTVICAGTGSGKTMAFYLPAYSAMASLLIPSQFWTKCLAIYPRNELLKDQLREALANARRIGPALLQSGKRRLIVGALFGATPNDPKRVTTGDQSWPQFSLQGELAYECPFVRCPDCGSRMGWLGRDVDKSLEVLHCSDTTCAAVVEQDEIRLTRRRMLSEPPDVLFTSTEMLNQRIADSNFRRLFGIDVQPDKRPLFVLVDEVHSYEGVHGAHVALLLRRWARASDAKPHFVGLSATLADAPRFFAELVGLPAGYVAEISPVVEETVGKGAEYMVALRGDPTSGTSLLSTTIQAAMLLRRTLALESNPQFGTKVFVFTDNLDVTNRLYHNLLDAEGFNSSGRPNLARPTGSLANLRASTLPNARPRFVAGQNWQLVEEIGHSLSSGSRVRVGRTSSQDLGVDAEAGIVVATSALEVGYDDPEVGAVLQHKAPQSASAYLQRKGRAGRTQDMRPWTVVVLSDFGRDRAAFQAYEQLFSPSLQARYLPLTNRAVLKMQGTFALFEWLAHKVPAHLFANPWSDFSRPSSEITNNVFSEKAAVREKIYIHTLQSLLSDLGTREDLARFLGRSLSIDLVEVEAILWDPPRSIMMEAAPTLLRRLESGWRSFTPSRTESHASQSPLPEFVPRTLFSDLELPEVIVHLPQQGSIPERFESMPVASAMKEFAPGRVSRRFGVSFGNEKYWISNGTAAEIAIDKFCPSSDRVDLGPFRFVNSDGIVESVRVFRPHALLVERTPLQIQQSSNSSLEWNSEIVPTDKGHSLDLPDSRRWDSILKSIEVHSHHLGLPLEVRRFAKQLTASVAVGRQAAVATHHAFVYNSGNGELFPAALGFATDVDGFRITFAYPKGIATRIGKNTTLVRGLRTARFRDLLQSSSLLRGFANTFQVDWLAQIYQSIAVVASLRFGISLAEAIEREDREELTAVQDEVMATIMQASWLEEDVPRENSEEEGPAGDRATRRLQELSALLANPAVRSALREASTVLWEPVDDHWETWLKKKFKATLGTAILEAASMLCPRLEEGSLILNFDPLITSDSLVPHASNEDELWFTETTIGGGGFIEEFVLEYSRNPRRFLRLIDAAISPSDLEITSEAMTRVVQLVAMSSLFRRGPL